MHLRTKTSSRAQRSANGAWARSYGKSHLVNSPLSLNPNSAVELELPLLHSDGGEGWGEEAYSSPDGRSDRPSGAPPLPHQNGGEGVPTSEFALNLECWQKRHCVRSWAKR